MHGAGNDYVYVNGFANPLPPNPSTLAPHLSDRHKGIGADGLILISASDEADAEMRMFNADGSLSEMCGNGLRCVAKLLCDEGVVDGSELSIKTGAGILRVEVQKHNGLVEQVRIEMGLPQLKASEVPTLIPGDASTEYVVAQEVEIAGRRFPVTCVSMGNPHCVVYLEDLDIDATQETAVTQLVHTLGPAIENHPLFPARVNVEFVTVDSPNLVRQRTWERGSGETLACGTGASAVCVAGVLTGRTGNKITAELLGGTLELEWSDVDSPVILTGPATKVFDGQIEI